MLVLLAVNLLIKFALCSFSRYRHIEGPLNLQVGHASFYLILHFFA